MMILRPHACWFMLIVLVGVSAAAAGPAGAVVASGVVRSDEKVEIKSRQAAAITRIAIAEGATVRKGELLVEMSNGLQRAQVQAARAEVAAADAAIREAEAAVQRARSMLAEAELTANSARREYERNTSVADLVTERELHLSRDAWQRAEAERRIQQDEIVRSEAALETRRQDAIRARAQLGVAEVSFEETLIRAPFDGVVSRIHLRAGATPKGPDQALLDVQSLERLYVEVAVPLPYLRSVDRGMPVKVTIESEHATIATSLSGTVRYVYPEIDTALRMFRIKVGIPAKHLRVLPGMLATVTIPR
jgi:multidrug efflux pump subunit AcrA (membrane-fusion protein)